MPHMRLCNEEVPRTPKLEHLTAPLRRRKRKLRNWNLRSTPTSRRVIHRTPLPASTWVEPGSASCDRAPVSGGHDRWTNSTRLEREPPLPAAARRIAGAARRGLFCPYRLDTHVSNTAMMAGVPGAPAALPDKGTLTPPSAREALARHPRMRAACERRRRAGSRRRNPKRTRPPSVTVADASVDPLIHPRATAPTIDHWLRRTPQQLAEAAR